MKTRLLILIALGACLIAMPTSALGNSSRGSSNAATFADSIGEDANAPDITSVVVSNDDAGMITFQVNISNRPALTADMFMFIFLNTDQNATTGDAQAVGAEYLIELDPGAVGLLQWNGTDYAPATSQTSLTFAYSNGATIHVSAADLGKTKALSFGVIAFSGFALDANGMPDFTNLHRDFAPDSGHGFFSYQVLTKLILNVTAFNFAPKPVRAGGRVSASMAVNENDTNGPVKTGTVACNASIAFKRIVAVAHVVANGVANCVWRIPATAKGKVLRGTITLTVQGVQVTRSFTAKIV